MTTQGEGEQQQQRQQVIAGNGGKQSVFTVMQVQGASIDKSHGLHFGGHEVALVLKEDVETEQVDPTEVVKANLRRQIENNKDMDEDLKKIMLKSLPNMLIASLNAVGEVPGMAVGPTGYNGMAVVLQMSTMEYRRIGSPWMGDKVFIDISLNGTVPRQNHVTSCARYVPPAARPERTLSSPKLDGTQKVLQILHDKEGRVRDLQLYGPVDGQDKPLHESYERLKKLAHENVPPSLRSPNIEGLRMHARALGFDVILTPHSPTAEEDPDLAHIKHEYPKGSKVWWKTNAEGVMGPMTVQTVERTGPDIWIGGTVRGWGTRIKPTDVVRKEAKEGEGGPAPAPAAQPGPSPSLDTLRQSYVGKKVMWRHSKDHPPSGPFTVKDVRKLASDGRILARIVTGDTPEELEKAAEVLLHELVLREWHDPTPVEKKTLRISYNPDRVVTAAYLLGPVGDTPEDVNLRRYLDSVSHLLSDRNISPEKKMVLAESLKLMANHCGYDIKNVFQPQRIDGDGGEPEP